MLTKLGTVTVVLLVASASSAAADDWWGQVSCSQNQAGCDLVAGANVGIAPAPGSAAAGGTGGRTTPDPSPPCVPSVPPGLTDPADQEAWHRFACASPGSASGSFDGPLNAIAPQDLAMVARSRLRLASPVVGFSPAGDQLVHVPTWLWLTNGWESVSANAAVPGVTVNAVARPESAEWSLGDGSTVMCSGPGVRYPGTGDAARSSPDCGHTYRQSSVETTGESYSVVVTVRWSVAWTGVGQSGTLPGLSTTSSASLRVLESQALNTG